MLINGLDWSGESSKFGYEWELLITEGLLINKEGRVNLPGYFIMSENGTLRKGVAF